MNTKTEAENGSSSNIMTGSYDGGISILYFYEDWGWGTIMDSDNFTHSFNDAGGFLIYEGGRGRIETKYRLQCYQ